MADCSSPGHQFFKSVLDRWESNRPGVSTDETRVGVAALCDLMLLTRLKSRGDENTDALIGESPAIEQAYPCLFHTWNNFRHRSTAEDIKKLVVFSHGIVPHVSTCQDVSRTLSDILEASHHETRGSTGVFYTSTHECRFIIHRALAYFFLTRGITLETVRWLFSSSDGLPPPEESAVSALRALVSTITIYDPTVGSGEFLVGAFQIMHQIAEKLGCDDPILPRLFGDDIDPLATATTHARLSLESIVIGSGEVPQSSQYRCCNSLWTPHPLAFDLVVGNPPYVRQESIPASEKTKFDVFMGERNPGQSWSRRMDYYCYFFYALPQMLSTGGIAALITSNSFLDVEYGRDLLRHLTASFSILEFSMPFEENNFTGAFINTVSTFLYRGESNEPTLFLGLRKHYEHYLGSDDALLGIQPRAEEEHPSYQVRRVNLRHTPLEANLGNLYFRAPQIYFEFLATEGLFRLDTAFEIKFGIKSGANDFFYLRRSHRPNEYVTIQGTTFELEPQFVRPLLKSPRDSYSIQFEAGNLEHVIVAIEPGAELWGSHMAEYIAWGENATIEISQGKGKGTTLQGFHQKPSLRGRNPWYVLEPGVPNHLFLMSMYHDRFRILYTKEPVHCDARLYSLRPRSEGYPPLFLAALLNCTITLFFIECLGRANFGMGALDLKVYEARQVRVVNPSLFSIPEQQEIIEVFESMSGREILPLPQELGMSDRRALDSLVFAKVGLRPDILDALYAGFLEMHEKRMIRGHRRGYGGR